MANFPTSVSTDANLFIAVSGLQTTLAVAVGTGDTTLTLTSTSNFPSTGMVTVDNNEVVSYTGISGADLTGCTRGADGTTAFSHAIGVTVGLTVVAAHHNRLKDEVIAVETVLGASFAKNNLTSTPGTDGITVTGGTNAVIGSGTSISQQAATNAVPGYLTATDHSTFATAATTAAAALPAASFTDAAVTGKLITGYVSGAGIVGVGDTILQAIDKLNGNDAAKLPLAGGTMTGDITMSNDTAIVLKETTANGTDSVTVKAPASVTTSYTIQLPPAVASAGQTITDAAGNGVLSWATPAGGITQLTSDVTAGPGAGSQAATVASVGGQSASNVAAAVTTANNALPKAGGTMTGAITMNLGTNAEQPVYFQDGSSNKFELYSQTQVSIDHFILYNYALAKRLIEFICTSTNSRVDIYGTTSDESATAGTIGERITASVSNGQPSASNAWTTIGSIALTAGDWDVSVMGNYKKVTDTSVNYIAIAPLLTTNSGNGYVGGQTGAEANWTSTTAYVTFTLATKPIRFSVPSTTTVYLETYIGYTGTKPQMDAIISARRMR